MIINKKVISLLLMGIVATTLLSGCSKAGSGSDSEYIKIGAVFPLTGDVSAMGQSSKNAIELYCEEVNKNGGVLGKKVKVIYEDDQNQPQTSANAVQKLINNDRVVGILGSYASKCSIAMGPIATSNKKPMVTIGTNPKVTTSGGEYVFRSAFVDSFQGTATSTFASKDLNAKTAAVLYDVGNDYSKGLAEYFQQNFQKLGGKILSTLTYNSGDQDFNAQLTKIKPLNPDVLFLPDYYGTVGLIAKQARSKGINATFIGGDGWDSPVLFKTAGDAINNSYFSNFFSPDDVAPEVVSFRKAYEAKYNKTPDATAGAEYDSCKILINAIEKAKSTDGEKIKEALKATNLKIMSGQVTYDNDRNPKMGAVIIKIENGKETFLKKVNP